jgi:hypothetical protein
MVWKMQMNNDDQKCMIKAKIEINIEKKKHVRFANFKVARNMGVLTNVNFKAKVKELLDL